MADDDRPTATAAPVEAQALRRPASTVDLFIVFTQLALQGFGGVLPIAQRMLVDRHRWLTREQFLELLSVSQVLPGPNVVNLSLIVGDRFFGWRGAAFAMAGMIAAPTVIVLVLAIAAGHLRQWPAVAGALHGMGIVAAGLILGTALKLTRGLRKNALGITWCAVFVLATLLAVGLARWPLALVILGLGSVSSMVAWRRIRP